MNHSATGTLEAFFKRIRTIAVVGLSPKPDRASNRIALYMQRAGYRIIPVRPGGQEILGEPSYPTLDDIPADLEIDLVNVFRRGEDTPPIAEAAVRIGAKGLWLQSGIVSDQAMEIARSGGLFAIQDRCLKTEHVYLSGRF